MYFKGVFSILIYADPTVEKPFLWLGMPTGTQIEQELIAVEYKHGVVPMNQYMSGHGQADIMDSEYYQVKSNIPFKIGNILSYKNRKWYVTEIKAELDKAELIYTYTLAGKGYLNRRRYDNPLFAGMTLLGTVLHTEAELLKIQLMIDEKETGDEYLYEWIPDTGSVMYCMPEKGSQVALYFADSAEESARVVSCIRTNCDTCQEYEDTSKRSLTTTYHKKMYLNDITMGFDGGEDGQLLALGDMAGVFVGSNRKIKIKAQEGIKISGRNVKLSAPKQMNIQV